MQALVSPVLEGTYYYRPDWSFAATAAGWAVGTGIADYPGSLSLMVFDMRGRYHPLNSAFFVGLSVGYSSLQVKSDNRVSSLSSGAMDRIYVTPHVGWQWINDSGFTFGTDFGIQVPLSHTVTTVGTLTASQEKVISSIFKPFVLPSWTIIRLGYSF